MKRYLVLFAVAFALVFLSGYATFKLLTRNQQAKVPDLLAMTTGEAEDALSRTGLSLKIDGEDYDPMVPRGGIIRQSLNPAMEVTGSGSIHVTLSKGPITLLMPSVRGETLEAALAIFKEKGLMVSKTVRVHSDETAKDLVLAQEPPPHERTGGAITIIVSNGPYDVTYFCPSFVGLPAENAMALAGELDLKVSVKGTGRFVKSQWPEPETERKPGDKIYLELWEGVVWR